MLWLVLAGSRIFEGCWGMMSLVERCWGMMSLVEGWWVLLRDVEGWWVLLRDVEGCVVERFFAWLVWVMLRNCLLEVFWVEWWCSEFIFCDVENLQKDVEWCGLNVVEGWWVFLRDVWTMFRRCWVISVDLCCDMFQFFLTMLSLEYQPYTHSTVPSCYVFLLSVHETILQQHVSQHISQHIST